MKGVGSRINRRENRREVKKGYDEERELRWKGWGRRRRNESKEIREERNWQFIISFFPLFVFAT